jgi:dTDP-4-amino-4,6-dideoxygalactose transaminase
MPEPDWSLSTHWLSACTVDPAVTGLSAGQLIQRLSDEMIEARPLWKPMHRQPVFAGCRYYAAGNDSVSDRLFDTGLCLPSGSNMSTAELDRIIATIERILASAR